MNKYCQNFRKSAELVGAICGGLLISLPVIPQAALAQQPTSKVNPCPSIFYEEPHNNRVVVPQGCPPNALTQRLAAQGLLPVSPTTSTPSQPGLGVGGEIPQTGTPTALNPCPRVFYEDPFNSRSLVPQGCPPNAFTQQQQVRETSPTQAVPVSPQTPTTQPNQTVPVSPRTPRNRPTQAVPVSPQTPTTQPLVAPQQPPVTTIALADGRVNVRLVNDTMAKVTYQVIGDTAPRSLQGRSDVMLKSLSTPITITFQREDGGFLLVTPQPSSQAGMLEVRFNETGDASEGRSAMRIQRNGSVFLN